MNETTLDICIHCDETIWSENPNASGCAWRDDTGDWCCQSNPAKRWNGQVIPGAFGAHQIAVKPMEVEAAIASIQTSIQTLQS